MNEPSGIHILVVDDDPEIRVLLRRLFEREGYKVSEASNGAELMAHVSAGPLSLVTLDLGLGGEDGLELARRVRAVNNVPIVMITGKGDTIDRVVGLELGADDYIAKPFHLREVLARVRAVLRRYGDTSPATAPVPTESPTSVRGAPPSEQAAPATGRLCFGTWVLDPARRELQTIGGDLCELTTAEYNLLDVLVARPGRVLSRDNLMDLLKGHEWTPLDRTIDNLVARLRKKIEDEEGRPRLIKTVRGVGYVFTADVRRG